MARKKPHEEHENHERWMVSYADFITLLFAFFVVMYSISSVNEGKYRVLSDAIVAAFRQPQKSLQPIQVGQPVRAPNTIEMEMQNRPVVINLPVFTQTPEIVERPQGKESGGRQGESSEHGDGTAVHEVADLGEGEVAIKKIADDVLRAVSHLVDQGLVSITRHDLWLEIEMKDSILFSSGSARLHPQAAQLLGQLARILRDFDNPIRVEGFTDNVPINTVVYPSNWELSAARAASVVRLFAGSEIDPNRLSALGYGEHRPIASNDTAEGRAKNRRVVLVVLADRQVEQLLREHEELKFRAADRRVLSREPEESRLANDGDKERIVAALKGVQKLDNRRDDGESSVNIREGGGKGPAIPKALPTKVPPVADDTAVLPEELRKATRIPGLDLVRPNIIPDFGVTSGFSVNAPGIPRVDDRALVAEVVPSTAAAPTVEPMTDDSAPVSRSAAVATPMPPASTGPLMNPTPMVQPFPLPPLGLVLPNNGPELGIAPGSIGTRK